MLKKNKTLKLYLHPGQQTVFVSPKRFKVLVSSRRYGKSRLMLTMIIDKALNYKGAYDKASPPVVLLGMPSLKQAKQIHWNPLVKLLEGHPGIERIYKSECRISFKGNKPDIILRGLNEDNGDNCRGLKIYFAGLDEMQDIKPIAWTEVIMPALIDTKGSCALLTGCVAPNTFVLPRQGMTEIVEFNQDSCAKEYQQLKDVELYGLNNEFHKADSFFNNGYTETKIITSSFGFTLEASLNHPIWTKNGWKKMEELKEGDTVAIAHGMDIWGTKDPIDGFKIKRQYVPKTKGWLQPNQGMTKDFAYFLGLWLYQGTNKKQNGKHYISVKTTTQQMREFLESGKILGAMFKQDVGNVWSYVDNDLVELLKHIGMSTVSRTRRTLPLWLFQGRKSWAIAFIQGFMDIAGSIGTTGNRVAKIIHFTCNKTLAQQFQLLLSNLGVIAKVFVLPHDPEMAQLELTGSHFDTYCQLIGFGSDNKKTSSLGVQKLNPPDEPFNSNDYFWDTIESISDSENQTYDFTVPDTNSFWSNGFISHNTPKGYGTFFHSLYENGDKYKDWGAFHRTIYDNPFIPREEIERIKESLPEKVFRQECLASWENFDGQIFSSLSTDNIIPDENLPTYFEQVYLGVDWGDVNPALVVVGKMGNTYFIIDFWENPNPNTAIEQRVHNDKALQFVSEHNVSRAFADPSQPGRILTMRKSGIPKLMGGYNRVNEGNGIVNTLLYQKRLMIAESCRRVYEDMGAYHRTTKEGLIKEEVAEAQQDHLCFVAGTQVLTETGWQNIESLKVKDKVWSSKGLQNITFTGSRLAETVEVKDFNSSAFVRCTPDHPFQTNNGLISAENLSVMNHLNYLEQSQWESLLGSVNNLTDSLWSSPALECVGKYSINRVYNIEVEESHNYYIKIGSNAVLVSNCDALRYVLATLEHKNIENIIPEGSVINTPEKPVPKSNSLFAGLI